MEKPDMVGHLRRMLFVNPGAGLHLDLVGQLGKRRRGARDQRVRGEEENSAGQSANERKRTLIC